MSSSSSPSEHNTPQVGTTEDAITAGPDLNEVGEEETVQQAAQVDREEKQGQQALSEYEAQEDQIQEQLSAGIGEGGAEKIAVAQQEQQPTMSPEQTLLLQVLRRAKRQQDLIVQVQKNLKVLSNIEKSMGKTVDQIKQLQSAVKKTQKQVIQVQRQIAIIERIQERNYQRLANERKRSATSKRSKASARGRKIKSKGK